MPCTTLILSLVGFQQLLDNLKLAIFEKKFFLFLSFTLNIKQQNSEFFSRQATTKRLVLFKSTYMVAPTHQFWLDLNNSSKKLDLKSSFFEFLTFSKKLDLKNLVRLFATINQ